jgi:alpha-D-ribose 1-methylphosphonate 5-triphosphate synthase subunit PhnH
VLGGLADPVLDSQRVFRVALEAMAHPGRVLILPTPVEVPSPLTAGAAALCLALLDFETPLWLDRQAATAEVVDYLRFHCGVSVVAKPEVAVFALITSAEAMPPLAVFASGSDEYPDRSTTLIVQVQALRRGSGRRMTGPGIDGEARLTVDGLSESFWSMWRENQALFPRGLDVFLTAGVQVAALPRTVSSEV